MQIYVGNLTPDTSEYDLLDVFTEIGKVTSALVIREKDGTSKGFAFLEMPNIEEAKQAMKQVGGKNIKGNKVFVNEAKEKAPKESSN